MSDRKKIYISADIEGTAGAFLWEDGRKGTEEYRRQCQIMGGEVLSIVRALNEKYDSCEILIKDAHATGGNLNIADFPDNCRIIRGWDESPIGMMQGIDESFDFAVLAGYHSGAGSGGAPLAHTLNSRRYDRMELNGKVISEFVISYYTALMYGVPVAIVSGDAALAKEVKEYDARILTVAVQEGRGNSVTAMTPAKVRRCLEEAVREAKELSCTGGLPREWHLAVRYYSHGEAKKSSFYPGCVLTDPKTVEFRTGDFYEILRALMFI